MKRLLEMIGLGPKKTFEDYMHAGKQALLGGDFAEAEKELTRALQMAEEQDKPVMIAESAMALGKACEEGGKYQLAEGHYRKGHRAYEDLDDNDKVASALVTISNLYIKQRRIPDAQQLLHYTLSVYQQHHGQDYPEIARTSVILAQCYLDQNALVEAENLLRRAERIADVRPLTDADKAHLFYSLAMCLERQTKSDEASSYFTKSLGFFGEHTDPKEALSKCACLHEFGRVKLRQGRTAEAAKLLKQAVELAEQYPGYLSEGELVDEFNAAQASAAR